MALTFAGGAADRVDIGAAASLQGLIEFSFLAWINPSALAATRFLFGGPWQSASASVLSLTVNDVSGNMQFQIRRNTTNGTYTSSSLALTTSAWQCVACTFSDSVGSGKAHIYKGDLATILAEPTYSANTDGSGTVRTEAGGTYLIGDRNSGGAISVNSSFAGSIAVAMFFNRALSLGELKSLQFHPSKLSGCVGYYQLGFDGTSTQPDWSGTGNAGTVTSATQSAHVPLGPMFGYSSIAVPYVVAAAGGFLPAWARGSNQLIGSGAYVS